MKIYGCETIQMPAGPDQLFAESLPAHILVAKKQPYLEKLMSIDSTPVNATRFAFCCLMSFHLPRTPELKIPFFDRIQQCRFPDQCG